MWLCPLIVYSLASAFCIVVMSKEWRKAREKARRRIFIINGPIYEGEGIVI